MKKFTALFKKCNKSDDIIFEWISYNQFSDIEEIGRGGFATAYSAILKNSPLYYNHYDNHYIRKLNKTVALKCIHNSQNFTNELLNEV